MAGSGGEDGVFIICLEASDLLLEPMCDTWELQQELVPYVQAVSLQHDHFLKLPKTERQAKVKILMQQILSGESGNPGEGEEEAESPGQIRMEEALSPHRFWAHLRAKYGTRLGLILEMLQLMEPMLRPRRVLVLRFEGEPTMPSASLIFRASQPLSSEGGAYSREFAPGGFSAAGLNNWLQEVPSARVPPLWSRLAAAKEAVEGSQNVSALILCAQSTSTETIPEALAVAGRSLCHGKQVPCLSAVAFGSDFTSERLAALEDLCAWSGGLSFNVDEPGMLRAAADGLAAHLFQADARFLERRRYYAQKQELGTCFMDLPRLVKDLEGDATPSRLTPLRRRNLTGLPALLVKASSLPIDYAVPSESMLTVLSDVTLVLAHRWSRSLRVWRIRRGMRDLVFGEPGSIGLDFEEPVKEASGAVSSTWRLRATHPPASALKMEEGSELVAINRVRVTPYTPRSEVARRISSRPVSLTFRLPKSGKEVAPSEIFPMVVAEIVVSELREGLTPLKTAQPPLSSAVQRVQAVKARKLPQHLHQANSILESLRGWGTMPGTTVPAWVEHLKADSPLGRRWTKVASMDLFAREPGLLYRVLLFCGEVVTLARASLSCCCWRGLLTATSKPQRRLWSWALRHGEGPSAKQRAGFWRWALRDEASLAAQVNPTSEEETLLDTVSRVDAASLSRLCSGLGGAVPGLEAAQSTADNIAAALGGTGRLPASMLQRLLVEPWHCQRLWLLSDAALPWLVMQCRYFQVAIAAHVPNLFRHLIGEGLAPELFFCRWLQGLFQSCLTPELQLRIWDLFIFERSFKVFVKLAVAIFALLEKRLIGQDIEKMMDLLFDSSAWSIPQEEFWTAVLSVKVTRSMMLETA
ncbi:unnamed protein product [Effrenium voratum]|uniref:Rab-GAP TBC domain-containing protein n=1 Tax=Effrenium voratum TaxID=2562239 RepID=A0AA36ICH4_9DINO|nr:unnamed protein product [Effrenium voratum]